MIRRTPTFIVFGLSLCLSLTGAQPFAQAFHQWQIKEVFSNADGSVQFVEMFSNPETEIGEIFGYILQADSETGGIVVSRDFSFPSSLAPVQPNVARHLLIATPGFAAIPGSVTPDFILPDPGVNGPFFNPNATNITISYSGSGDSINFPGATLPKNGVHSLTDIVLGVPWILQSEINSPTNFNNQAGSINVAPPPTGDYNGNHVVDAADYIIWRDQLNQTGVPARTGPDGNGNGTIDLGDYTFWRQRFGNVAPGAASAVPEPTSVLGLGFLTAVLCTYRRRR